MVRMRGLCVFSVNTGNAGRVPAYSPVFSKSVNTYKYIIILIFSCIHSPVFTHSHFIRGTRVEKPAKLAYKAVLEVRMCKKVLIQISLDDLKMIDDRREELKSNMDKMAEDALNEWPDDPKQAIKSVLSSECAFLTALLDK